MIQDAFAETPRHIPLAPFDDGHAGILARSGELAVRLAHCEADVRAAQHLRFEIFYREMAATPTPEMLAANRDFDPYDALCDHLLVTRETGGEEQVVGTYRLLRKSVADTAEGFYSRNEFDLGPLLAKAAGGTSLMELGRSCVHPDFRSNATIQLLWRGITGYMTHHGVDVLFGCASLPGTDPDALALPLSFLHAECLAPPEWRVRALPDRHTRMDRIGGQSVSLKAAVATLPPLIKGYLRLGAWIGDGAVIDRQFGTTDVFIILPVSRIPDRYFAHFDR